DGRHFLARLQFPMGVGRKFVYRPDTGLSYYAGNYGPFGALILESFDLNTYMPVGLFTTNPEVPSPNQFFGLPQRLISVGSAGLALIATGSGSSPVYVYPLSAIQTPPPVRVPSAQPNSSGIRRFAM